MINKFVIFLIFVYLILSINAIKMATIKNGILGPVEGPLSRVTGYIRLGVPVLRAKPDPEKVKARSAKQIAANNRFSFAMKFVKPATPFLNVGFSVSRAQGQTAHNVAVSHALRAVAGENPDFHFNYENILVADGSLPEALNPSVERTTARTLQFSWEATENLSYQRSQDQVMLLAYLPEEELAFYTTSGARRGTGQETLAVCSGQPGQVFETYIAFISDDRKTVSKSIYTGQIVIE
jgi:hypothetical protein